MGQTAIYGTPLRDFGSYYRQLPEVRLVALRETFHVRCKDIYITLNEALVLCGE